MVTAVFYKVEGKEFARQTAGKKCGRADLKFIRRDVSVPPLLYPVDVIPSGSAIVHRPHSSRK